MCKPTTIRTDVKIDPDVSRVLIRPFIPSPERAAKIMARIAAQSDSDIKEHLDKILDDFSSRHRRGASWTRMPGSRAGHSLSRILIAPQLCSVVCV